MPISTVETGYKPQFALGAAYAGENAAYQEAGNQLELIKQYLANQREQQTQPLDLQVKQMEAARAQQAMSPEMLDAYSKGYIGQMQTQEAAGKTKMAGLPGALDESAVTNLFSKFRKTATDPTANIEDRKAALQGIQQTAQILGITPENLFALQKEQVKQQGKQITPSTMTALMNWASSAGVPVSTAIDVFQKGLIDLGQTQGTQQIQQPTKQAEPGKFAFDYNALTDEDKVTVDNLLSIVQQDPRQSGQVEQELRNIAANYPSKLPQQPDVLSQEFARKTASQREARYSDVVAIAGNEAQASIKNLVNMPVTATSGFFGEDTKLGNNIFDAPARAIKKTLSQEYVNSYNAEVDNIGAYFARLMSGGLSVTQADIDKFTNQYRVKEGETVLTALTRFAQMRQAFERAAEVKLKSKATPPEQMSMWEDAVSMVKDAIPLTVNDVNDIRNSKSDTKTFAQVMAEKKSSMITPDEFNSKWASLKSGESLVGPDGKTYTKR